MGRFAGAEKSLPVIEMSNLAKSHFIEFRLYINTCTQVIGSQVSVLTYRQVPHPLPLITGWGGGGLTVVSLLVG